MAVSSIFARVIIDNKKDAEAFVNALEQSEKATKNEKLTPTYRFVSDPDEIRAAVAVNRAARKRKES